MSFAEFAASVANDAEVPPGLSPALTALWFDGREEWNQAHAWAQEDRGTDAAWVHAYLHRKEGDVGNATYWYEKAGRTRPTNDATPRQEWEQIARELLGERGPEPRA